ncbi:hypothetical protein [Vibrio sp. C8]
MTEQNVGQILKAFNSIEAKIEQQNSALRELNLKVKTLESQNKQLAQMINKLQTPAAPKNDVEQVALNKQFQASVAKSLDSIEDKSKKAIELIKANAGGKKRAWP